MELDEQRLHQSSSTVPTPTQDGPPPPPGWGGWIPMAGCYRPGTLLSSGWALGRGAPQCLALGRPRRPVCGGRTSDLSSLAGCPYWFFRTPPDTSSPPGLSTGVASMDSAAALSLVRQFLPPPWVSPSMSVPLLDLSPSLSSPTPVLPPCTILLLL